MDQLKKYFTGSSEKSANIKFDVNGLKDSSRADTTTSIGVLINNSPKRGVYIDVVDGQSLLNVSVPVKERNLDLKVSGVFDNQTKSFDLLDYSFNHSDDDFPEHVVTLKVRGAKKIGEIMQDHTEEFLACIDKVEKKYEATSIKESSGCLELRFQHKSEQSARAMVADQKQIEGMFEEFVKSCGQEGDVSVHATYEFVERRELEAPAQSKDRTHSQSRTTGSDTGALGGRMITLDLEEKMNEEYFPKGLEHSTLMGPSRWITRTVASDTKKLCIEKIARWVSALRNSGGGKLHIKIPPPSVCDWDIFQESILNHCLEKCLLDDELQDDVFDKTVNKKEHIIVVDAKPSHELITFKFNTKIKTVASLLDPTKGKMAALLKRRWKETPAQLKGIDWNIWPGNSVFFVSARRFEHSFWRPSNIVNFLSEYKSLRECISAMSKNINGGSYFFGIDSHIEDGQTSCRIRGLQLQSSARELSMVLSRKLKELIDENFLVFDLGSGKFKIPPPDLKQCEVYEHGYFEFVFEVAVRPFNGVVFYERHGPESYKIDDKGELIRLSLDQWIRKMTT